MLFNAARLLVSSRPTLESWIFCDFIHSGAQGPFLGVYIHFESSLIFTNIFRGALLSFVEDILIRIGSSSTVFFLMPKQT